MKKLLNEKNNDKGKQNKQKQQQHIMPLLTSQVDMLSGNCFE